MTNIIDDSPPLMIPVFGDSVPAEPAIGTLTFDETANQILVYNENADGELSWMPVDTSSRWEMKYYVLRNCGGIVQGIFKTEVDTAAPPDFTLFLPDHEAPFQPMTAEEIDAVDYDMHAAFNTFPVLEERRSSPNGILLKFPD